MMSMSNRSFRAGLAVAAVAGLCTVASADIYNWNIVMDGPSESPPNASPGFGTAHFIFDTTLHTLTMDINFTGLLGTTTAAHIHASTAVPGAGTAGVATQSPFFTGFPIGVTSGSYLHTFDMTLTSSYNASFVTANGGTAAGAEAALLAAMLNNTAYLNIHTTVVPGGEIRGFIPTPGAAALLGLGGLVVARRRR